MSNIPKVIIETLENSKNIEEILDLIRFCPKAVLEVAEPSKLLVDLSADTGVILAPRHYHLYSKQQTMKLMESRPDMIRYLGNPSAETIALYGTLTGEYMPGMSDNDIVNLISCDTVSLIPTERLRKLDDESIGKLAAMKVLPNYVLDILGKRLFLAVKAPHEHLWYQHLPKEVRIDKEDISHITWAIVNQFRVPHCLLTNYTIDSLGSKLGRVSLYPGRLSMLDRELTTKSLAKLYDIRADVVCRFYALPITKEQRTLTESRPRVSPITNPGQLTPDSVKGLDLRHMALTPEMIAALDDDTFEAVFSDAVKSPIMRHSGNDAVLLGLDDDKLRLLRNYGLLGHIPPSLLPE